MCYDDNARPPLPPVDGGSAHGEDIVLTAADGTRFAAYSAYPDKPLGAQVIIYPDVRGLHQFYKELTLRFAETGIQAVAIDYFGRTAGLTARNDSFEYMPHVQQMHLETFFSDVKAAQEYLHSSQGGNAPTFAVGFCLGGTLSMLSGTQDLGFTGLVGFYAGMSRNMDGKGTLLDRAGEIKYPVLGLFGGADQGIPNDQVQALDQKLGNTGIEHEIISYPGAPHSFFDRRSTEFAEASTDAWNRVLRFITAHSNRQA
ncbi:carboxymethylenebutenolidase [Dictyobacter sp. S3.2.2.5]|uniref:Carboxymethylenebutenolidase n=1 Tax=Dictyobacter halimunensis TaxID=3026934 RepID=A0ABQ6FUJ5_9CHLR|nr:carboxymethylenebutenolidase [Dictyobacter sp. S3.2.2.5]